VKISKCVNHVTQRINRITLLHSIETNFTIYINQKHTHDYSELEKSKSHILIEIIEYVPNSVVTKTIIRKTTGNVSVVAIDIGEAMAEKTSPFDAFIQVIEGVAEVSIDSIGQHTGHTGQGIIVPAHTSNSFRANERFKMISTVIKSGYEENII
jgi:quercetin dioxygenase-like cupin family protein